TVGVWDAAIGRRILAFAQEVGELGSVAFSPDGQRLAAAAPDRVKIWDVSGASDAPTPLVTLRGHTDQVLCGAYTSDGRRLASASNDGTVKLWETTNGEELLTLKGHTPPVLAVAFSPDGQRLASTSIDRKVRLWEATQPTAEILLEREA